MDAVLTLSPTVGIQAACDHLAVARASLYRQRPTFGPLAAPPGPAAIPSIPTKPARALRSHAKTTSQLRLDGVVPLRQGLMALQS